MCSAALLIVFGTTLISGSGSCMAAYDGHDVDASSIKALRDARRYFLTHHVQEASAIISQTSIENNSLPDWALITKAKILIETGKLDEGLSLLYLVNNRKEATSKGKMEALGWAFYLRLTKRPSSFPDGCRSLFEFDIGGDLARIFDVDFLSAKIVERQNCRIRIDKSIADEVQEASFFAAVENSLSCLKAHAFTIPDSTFSLYITSGRGTTGFVFNNVIFFLDRSSINDILHESVHWFLGCDAWVDRVMSEAAANFKHAECTLGDVAFDNAITHVYNNYSNAQSIVNVLPMSSDVSNVDGNVLLAFSDYLVDSVGVETFWDMYYCIDDPFKTYMHMTLAEVVADFLLWVQKRSNVAR